MITERDLPALTKALAGVMRAEVAKATAPLLEQIDGLKAALAALPVPKDGRDGKDGVDGTPGADGKDGAPGPKGDSGEKGADGINGKDAPPVDVDAIVERVKSSIPVPMDGANGKDGAPGVDGKDATVDVAAIVETVIKSIPVPKDGKDAPAVDLDALAKKAASLIPAPAAGKDGASVEPAVVKAMVLEAVDTVVKALPPPRDGRDGKDGKDGRPGEPGIPGKDAAEIVPLNGIDETRSYPMGIYASHNGGTFRAYRMTDPVVDGDMQAAGWQVCMQGIKDQRQTLASDARTQITTTELSDGKCIVSKVKHPAMLFRGTWSQGITYDRGDTVSWGGNAWHAKRATSEKPGDDAQDWEIAARRGRDGKDLGRTT